MSFVLTSQLKVQPISNADAARAVAPLSSAMRKASSQRVKLNIDNRSVSSATKGIQGLRKELGGVVKQIPGLRHLSSAFAGPAGAVAAITVGVTSLVSALVWVGKTAFKTGQELSKFSDIAGAVGIGASKIQLLTEAAKFSGASFEDISSILRTFSKNVGLYLSGSTSRATQSFKQLGISFSDLIGKSQEERFDLITEKIRNIGDSARQAAIASRIFGEAGSAEFLSYLNQGKESTDELNKSLTESGKILRDSQHKAVDDAADSLERLGWSWDAIKNKIAVEILPAASIFAASLKESSGELEKIVTSPLFSKLFVTPALGVFGTDFIVQWKKATDAATKFAESQLALEEAKRKYQEMMDAREGQRKFRVRTAGFQESTAFAKELGQILLKQQEEGIKGKTFGDVFGTSEFNRIIKNSQLFSDATRNAAVSANNLAMMFDLTLSQPDVSEITFEELEKRLTADLDRAQFGSGIRDAILERIKESIIDFREGEGIDVAKERETLMDVVSSLTKNLKNIVAVEDLTDKFKKLLYIQTEYAKAFADSVRNIRYRNDFILGYQNELSIDEALAKFGSSAGTRTEYQNFVDKVLPEIQAIRSFNIANIESISDAIIRSQVGVANRLREPGAGVPSLVDQLSDNIDNIRNITTTDPALQESLKGIFDSFVDGLKQLSDVVSRNSSLVEARNKQEQQRDLQYGMLEGVLADPQSTIRQLMMLRRVTTTGGDITKVSPQSRSEIFSILDRMANTKLYSLGSPYSGKTGSEIKKMLIAQFAEATGLDRGGSLGEALSNIVSIREKEVEIINDSIKANEKLIELYKTMPDILNAAEAARAIRGAGLKPVGFAKGGVVPGRGTRDSVPALLTPGEVVLPAPARMASGGSTLKELRKIRRESYLAGKEYRKSFRRQKTEMTPEQKAKNLETAIRLSKNEHIVRIQPPNVEKDAAKKANAEKAKKLAGMKGATALGPKLGGTPFNMEKYNRNVEIQSRVREIRAEMAEIGMARLSTERTGKSQANYLKHAVIGGIRQNRGNIISGIKNVIGGIRGVLQQRKPAAPPTPETWHGKAAREQRERFKARQYELIEDIHSEKMRKIREELKQRYGFASGGPIYGSGSGDKVPALLEPGEFVLNKNATRSIGVSKLEKYNRKIGRYQTGGAVQQSSSSIIPNLFNIGDDSIKALNMFSSACEYMKNFPSEITMAAQHRVEVIINGAQIFAQIQPGISNLVVGEVNKALSKYVKLNLPDLPLPEATA